MRRLGWLVVGVCCLMAGPLWAATVISDFETQADVAAWHDENGTTITGLKWLALEPRWAVAGTHSMCFKTLRWAPGMGEWPAFEARPKVTDWSGADRLAFFVTNVTAFRQKLCVFISDGSKATRDGLLVTVDMQPYTYNPVVTPLSQLGNVNARDIRVLHFFTERPGGNMEVYIDDLCLLAPGEAVPTPPAAYLQQFKALQAPMLEQLRADLRADAVRLREETAEAPRLADWVGARLDKLNLEVDALARKLQAGGPSVLSGGDLSLSLREEVARLERTARAGAAFERVRPQVATRRGAEADVVVGFATSMEKVLPRGGDLPLRAAASQRVALARHEKEAFQVVVMPWKTGLKRVALQVSDLTSGAGQVFSADCVRAVPVGYVKTDHVPPYGSSHVGWWPDPILDFMGGADIATGDAQAFWVRVTAPDDQPAGIYRGKLKVVSAGAVLYAFDFSVEVYPFSVPVRSPLNVAVTFAPGDYATEASAAAQTEWRKDPDYPVNAWSRHRLEWADLLGQYYLNFDSLYLNGPQRPDFECLQRQHAAGTLTTFNLGYYGIMGESPEEQAAWTKDIMDRIAGPYATAKKLGLLDHAYIYGCDENPSELFPGVERAAKFLKEHFPGAMVLTTTYDHSFGTNSVLRSMDGFTPLTPSFSSDLASKVRPEGKQVWWYICCGPHHPFANMFVEYPAIDGRVLMGAQTAKYRPDGFLYYQISIWNARHCITGGPFTDWDPRSWTSYNGDGSWTCVGPDGAPLATVRLENFRDGLEDYAYARVLEETIKRVESKPALAAQRAAWLAEAKAALEVPAEVASSMTEFTSNPREVYKWRARMAEALKSAADCIVELP
jgi:hypothetical protein